MSNRHTNLCSRCAELQERIDDLEGDVAGLTDGQNQVEADLEQRLEAALDDRDKLVLAAEAGVQAFEFLGERLNYADGAAGESRANLAQLATWGEMIRAVIPEDRLKELLAPVYVMLETDCGDDIPMHRL